MRFGHISFRLAGTDGVSLETAKIVKVLNGMGHRNYYFAGELDDESIKFPENPIAGKYLAPYAHFSHPDIQWITGHAFGSEIPHPNLFSKIEEIAQTLEQDLHNFIDEFKIEIITIQNVFAIPMNLPLTVALFRVLKTRNIPVINHNHDFYWEREKYKINCVPGILKEYFPPDLPNIRQVVINSFAKQDLKRKGISSDVFPNIFDFENPPMGIDQYNRDLRETLNISHDELLFLQPTRVIPRKGIEFAVELVSQLTDFKIKFLITHSAEQDSMDYLQKIKDQAQQSNVDLLYLPDKFQPSRCIDSQGQKKYSLWDAYIHADFVTYPSLYEGFGNAILEMIYFRKPFLVNRYKVFQADIEPTGIKAVLINKKITKPTLEAVKELILQPELSQFYSETNYKIGRKYFSFDTAKVILRKIIESFNL